MDGTCLAEGAVAWEGSFQGGEGTRIEAGVGEDYLFTVFSKLHQCL